jgi:hypothetical protein
MHITRSASAHQQGTTAGTATSTLANPQSGVQDQRHIPTATLMFLAKQFAKLFWFEKYIAKFTPSCQTQKAVSLFRNRCLEGAVEKMYFAGVSRKFTTPTAKQEDSSFCFAEMSTSLTKKAPPFGSAEMGRMT